MHADSFGGAQQGAEVLRVLHGIEQQHKKRLVFVFGVFEDVGNFHVRIMPGFEHHALMLRVQAVQFLARDTFHRHFPLFGQFENLGHVAFFLDFIRYKQADGLTAPGAQGFINGITGIDDFFHKSDFT